jgi:IS30 family transposase
MNQYTQLSQEERYHITGFIRRQFTVSEIAKELKRHPSTIIRELSRNRCTSDNAYRAEVAHSYATARRRRVRRVSHFSKKQWSLVEKMLKQLWSPEQISNHLLNKGSFSISHETIYRYIIKDKKNGGFLYKYLRIVPKVRRKRYGTKDSRGILPNKRHISTRPKTVETREDIGHWEGDTVIGRDRHHCIVTLVERKAGLSIIKKIKARTATATTKAIVKAIKQNPGAFKTITFDNGTEFHDYKTIENMTNVVCYFATPYHSWERGTNENLNGLIRQYIPKKACMKTLTQAKCNWITRTIKQPA